MTTVDGVKGPLADPGQQHSNDSDGPPLRPGGAGPFAWLASWFSRARRKFERPVAWLLGRQLMGSVKGILLYSAYGKKLDPRDWMTAKAVSFDPSDDRLEPPAGVEKAALDEAIRRKGGFWFDYISDTGDGMKAVYSIAYLCLSDLSVPTLDPERLRAGEPVGKGRADGRELLPRGEFLFVGGDTAYHASDYMTLIDRIQNPFKWAYEDLVRDGGISEDEPPRPLFGIPGNHDYYDQLDGFRRQFRHPARWERRPPAYHGGAENLPPDRRAELAQLSVPGFYRIQEASYVAFRLPFGWWMWGLDTETGQIDERQKNFFWQFCRTARSRPGLARPDLVVPPQRLIVATCSPTTTFGKLADPEDYKAADAFGQLGIEQPFLPKDVKGSRRDNGSYDLAETGDERLKPAQCRLDLSGDVHHYARYWGPPPPARSIEPRVGAGDDAPKADRPTSYSYASVVSGIGGAFHHPSQTYLDEVREQSLYPSEARSTGEVARSVFKFWNIWGGGYVWLAGFIIAFLIYFAFTVPQSSRQFLNNLPHFGLGLASAEPINPTVLRAPEEGEGTAQQPKGPGAAAAKTAAGSAAPSGVEREEVKPLWYRLLGVGSVWIPPDPCRADQPRYFYGPCRVSMPWDFQIGLGMALVAALPLIVAASTKRLYEKQETDKTDEAHGEETLKTAEAGGTLGADAKPSRLVETPEGNKIKPARHDPETEGEPGATLWSLFALAFVLFFVGMVMVEPYRAHITPFGNSLLVLLTLVWAGAGVALSLRFSEFLFKKAHRTRVPWYDWTLPRALSVAGVLAVALGLWSFGRNNLPALLVSDALFIAAMLALVGGLAYALPFQVASDLLAKRNKAVAFVGKLLIGLWHLVLQVGVPFVLVREASLLTLLVAAALLALGTFAGEWLLSSYRRGLLALAWFAFGALTLALPLYLMRAGQTAGGGLWGTLTAPWFPTNEWTGWAGIVPSLVAGAVGAVTCCYWFGWYLGVCFAFNGHNNEVGGAARIERFKQFIRFRLDEDGLTGYVIAVNDPEEDGRKLTPHVVDVFRLRPKGAAAGGVARP